MTTITELKKLLFSMILKTPIWLVHLAANQSSVMSIPTLMMFFIVGKNSQDSKNHTEKPVGETENKIINPS